MMLGGILSIHRTGMLVSKRHTSTHLFVIWMSEKVFLARPRFCRIFLCVFTFLESMCCCIATIRCVDTHSVVTGDVPFLALVDIKSWDVIRYCSVVPTLVQDISVVPLLPAALVVGPVLRSFSPIMKTISRSHAEGLETPPGPRRVWDRLPQPNPFLYLLPPLKSAAQKGSLLLMCTVLWIFRGRARTPLSACWGRLDCREPFSPVSRTLVQFGHNSPQHKHF